MTYEQKKVRLQKLHTRLHRYSSSDDSRLWLLKELERAWVALEFYADDAWKVQANTSGKAIGGNQMTCPIDYDNGRRAREVLEE